MSHRALGQQFELHAVLGGGYDSDNSTILATHPEHGELGYAEEAGIAHIGDTPPLMKRLVDDVRERGVQNPIEVSRRYIPAHGQEYAEVTNGTHRLMAALISGQEMIPVRYHYSAGE